jgi:hypothetical protein
MTENQQLHDKARMSIDKDLEIRELEYIGTK